MAKTTKTKNEKNQTKGNAANSSETSMATQPGGSVTSRAASETRSGAAGSSAAGTTGNTSGANTSSTQTGAKFRHGLLQLMIHTIDPLHDGEFMLLLLLLFPYEICTYLHTVQHPSTRQSVTPENTDHILLSPSGVTLSSHPVVAPCFHPWPLAFNVAAWKVVGFFSSVLSR